MRLIHPARLHKVQPRIMGKREARLRWEESDSLADALNVCVSTGISGAPKQKSMTIDAVFGPMPGIAVSQLRASSGSISFKNERS